MYAHIDVKFNNLQLQMEDHGGYESRHKSMINLIRDGWRLHVNNEAPPEPVRFFTLYTDDIFNPMSHFCFAATNSHTAVRSMPHFIFDQWPECGMPDYESVFDKVVAAGERPPESDKVFWIGVAFDEILYPHCHRMKGKRVASRLPGLFDFREIEWRREGPDQSKHTPGYVSLPEHCKHRVLIDFGGIGFSARLPLLLSSGRPVIVVGRPHEAWFYWDDSFSPWEHYVPCGDKRGLYVTEKSVEDSVRWTFENPEEAAEIGKRGKEYALAYLTRSAAVGRIGKMMANFCRDMWPSH